MPQAIFLGKILRLWKDERLCVSPLDPKPITAISQRRRVFSDERGPDEISTDQVAASGRGVAGAVHMHLHVVKTLNVIEGYGDETERSIILEVPFKSEDTSILAAYYECAASSAVLLHRKSESRLEPTPIFPLHVQLFKIG
ncbi:hypothetical protein K438DRAFT_1779792 [Mycena galopus ATCC 62051]|nr:hypothetical protein K438DRAFT_1779792 [Mycena galopus ATCC 62051]